jgi:hypothetical protein
MFPTGELTSVLIFAILVEMLVEYFVKPLLPKSDAQPAPWWSNLPYCRYAAALAGMGLSIYYQLDILSMMFPQYVANYVGMILTGLLVSRGANYVHDWIADPLFERLISQEA